MEPVDTQYCDCRVNWGPRGPRGKQIKMDYVGDAKFKCPKCGTIEDLSKATYKIRLQFKKEKGCQNCVADGKDCGNKDCQPAMTVKIVQSFDPRLDTKWEKESTGTIKDALISDLDEWESEDFEDITLASHKEGVFDVELLYNYYRTCYEYEEYDMNLRIIAEKQVT